MSRYHLTPMTTLLCDMNAVQFLVNDVNIGGMSLFDIPTEKHADARNEWYTPARYIEAARVVMGGIDLDPASCAIANEAVRATRYYTIEENGLEQPWQGRLFINPPYSRTNEMKARHQSFIAMFTAKLLQHYATGEVTQAILLTSVQVDARWFQSLWQFPICFVDHKIHFNLPFKRDSYSFHMFGTCFVYLGPNEQKFLEVFSEFGACYPSNVVVRRQIKKPVNLELWSA